MNFPEVSSSQWGQHPEFPEDTGRARLEGLAGAWPPGARGCVFPGVSPPASAGRGQVAVGGRWTSDQPLGEAGAPVGGEVSPFLWRRGAGRRGPPAGDRPAWS